MPYLGLYRGDGSCYEWIRIKDGDVVTAHVELFLKMLEGGDMSLRETDKRPRRSEGKTNGER